MTALEAVTLAAIIIAPFVASFVTGPLVPVVVALLTKAGADAKLKTKVMIFVNLAVAIVAASTIDGVAILSIETVLSVILGMGVSQLSYDEGWRRVALNDRRGVLPNVGLGRAA